MIEKVLNEISRLKKELKGYSASEALDYIESYINTLQEDQSKGLEEEIEKIDDQYPVEIRYIREIAQHFTEWQRHQMKEVLQTEYEKGRFDMKEEMMKDAVEGEVVYKIGNAEIAPTDVRYKVMSDRVYIPNVKLGDKVQLIIIKPEQQ